MKPFIREVESWVLVEATGAAHSSSRTENQELFQLANGRYGLSGILVWLKPRLVPRTTSDCYRY
jgi:hypothetical protein